VTSLQTESERYARERIDHLPHRSSAQGRAGLVARADAAVEDRFHNGSSVEIASAQMRVRDVSPYGRNLHKALLCPLRYALADNMLVCVLLARGGAGGRRDIAWSRVVVLMISFCHSLPTLIRLSLRYSRNQSQ
jgi:hypothetical protein